MCTACICTLSACLRAVRGGAVPPPAWRGPGHKVSCISGTWSEAFNSYVGLADAMSALRLALLGLFTKVCYLRLSQDMPSDLGIAAHVGMRYCALIMRHIKTSSPLCLIALLHVFSTDSSVRNFQCGSWAFVALTAAMIVPLPSLPPALQMTCASFKPAKEPMYCC